MTSAQQQVADAVQRNDERQDGHLHHLDRWRDV